MYTLGNWPLPNNGYADKVYRTAYIWNMAVIRALDNTPKTVRLTQTLLDNIERYGYNHEKVSRLVMQYQPEMAKRYCKWCGEQIALFTNATWCGEHEHLAPAYWHEMERIRAGKKPNLIRSGGQISAPPKDMSKSRAGIVRRKYRKNMSDERRTVVSELSKRS